MPWYYDPQRGGCKIPLHAQDELRKQAEDFARTRPWHSRFQLKVRFKSQFCYLDAQDIKQSSPFPWIRLRYFRDNVWSMAFYTWSHERYEPCVFPDGKWEGTLEEAIEACEHFLV